MSVDDIDGGYSSMLVFCNVAPIVVAFVFMVYYGLVPLMLMLRAARHAHRVVQEMAVRYQVREAPTTQQHTNGR